MKRYSIADLAFCGAVACVVCVILGSAVALGVGRGVREWWQRREGASA